MPTLFSIIIPCFNYAKVLPRAIESVLLQSGSDYEVLVINDGSTDNSLSVAHEFAERSPSLINVIDQDNAGPAATRNRGVEGSLGKYLIFLDADDELLPGALAIFRERLQKRPEIHVLVAGHNSITESGGSKYISPGMMPNTPKDRVEAYLLSKRLVLSNGSVAFGRDVFRQYRYPEQYRSSEDLSVFVHALANYNCSLLDDAVAAVHKHGDSLRHDLLISNSVGLAIVDEVFSSERLQEDVLGLKSRFYIQRCLSLSRTAYLSKDYVNCKRYFHLAYKVNWKVVFDFSYFRKFILSSLKR